MKKRLTILGLLVILVLTFSACGQEEKAAGAQGTAAGEPKQITISAKNFEFDQKEIKIKKGEMVTLSLKNVEGMHSIKLDGYDKQIQAGKSITFTADKAGEFKYSCDLFCGPGHPQMEGKFMVE